MISCGKFEESYNCSVICKSHANSSRCRTKCESAVEEYLANPELDQKMIHFTRKMVEDQIIDLSEKCGPGPDKGELSDGCCGAVSFTHGLAARCPNGEPNSWAFMLKRFDGHVCHGKPLQAQCSYAP